MRNQSFAGWRGLALAASLVGLVVFAITGALAGAKLPGKSGSSGFGVPTGDDDHAFRQTLYPRSTYLWPFGTGPSYGENVDTSRWSAPGMLHTAVGSIDMTRGLPPFPAELRTGVKLDKLGAQYFIVQVHPDAFADGSFDRIRNSITSTGGAVVQEMAVAGFIVRLTAQGYASLQGLPGLIALEPYHPAFKLEPTIGRAPLPDPLKALSEVYTLELRLFPGENAKAVAQILAGLGASVTQILGNKVIVADVNRSKLAQVAALEPVYMVSEHLPNFVQGEETTTTIQTGKWNLGANPYHDAGVRGDGNGIVGTSVQILAVVDSGIQLDGGDISDTKTNAGTAGVGHRKVVLYTPTNAFGGSGDALGCDAPGSGAFTHGHTVSATALGNGSNTLPAYGGSWFATDNAQKQWKLDGVAPRAKVAMYDANVTPASGGCGNPGQGGISPGNLYDPPTPGPEGGLLLDAYTNGARVVNFSWGTTGSNTYSGNAVDIDDFLFNKKDVMLFVAAGNGSLDSPANSVWDATISNPATCKSCVVVGATGNANDTGGGPTQDNCAGFTSSGPVATSNRVAPILSAPGTDTGSMGIASEYNCRSSDNDQVNPVECDIVTGLSGTSFSSPAAAGAALLVRDFFAQGFYPDGSSTNPGNAADQKTTISGALVKAVLIASAEWVGPGTSSGTDPNRAGFNCGGVGDNQTWRYRFNNKQGYGRIQLNRALPLTTYASATGLIVADGGIAGGPNNTSLSGTANPSTTETTAINVCDTGQDLSVGLAWVEASGNALAKDLDLELVAPSGKTYFGNYYTDDNNKNNIFDAGENCDYAGPFPTATTGVLDPYPWSIPTCANSAHDTQNPTEGIHLSADPLANGVLDNPATGTVNEAADNQIELGNWTLKVIGKSFTGGQPYAVAVAGPVCIRSSARLQVVKKDGSTGTGNFVCNDTAKVTVNEVLDGTDDSINNNTAEISSRTTLKVWGVGTNGTFDGGTGDDVLLDSETGLVFTDVDGAGAGLEFRANVLALTSGTAQDPGNGALDIRSGNFLQVVYQDKTTGVPDANKVRTNSAKVDCQAKVAFGGVVWGQFGRDGFTLVNGGCEQDQRGFFTFGFPDKYMDAGETVGYRIAFSQGDTETLEDAQISLRCVVADTDSPLSCLPGTTDCADPDRTNNAACTDMTITDSPKLIGSVPTGAAVSANFTVRMATAITGTPVIEMVLGVSAQKSGRPIQGLAVSRHTLDVDEVSLFYSTDYPTGGTETYDVDNNESIQNPTTDPVDFLQDYQFETRTWSDLTATGLNTTAALKSPWNFDTNNGGFTVVLDNLTTRGILTTVAQWGEDFNGNNVLDTNEDRDPVNGVLDNNWSTNGGCGWQTKGAIATGGVWHTGRIDTNTPTACLANGAGVAKCQRNETLTGFTGANLWWEMLLTPVFKKVNKCCSGGLNGCPVTLPAACVSRTDSTGSPVFQPEFMWLGWNASMDLNDQLTYFTWEVDGDTTKIKPVDLTNDGSILNFAAGKIGARAGGNAPLFDGYPLFSNISKCQDTDGNGSVDRCGGLPSGAACTDDTPCTGNDVNGTVGGNRSGDNNCFFEGKASASTANAKLPFGLAKPADDDVRNGWCTSANASDKSRACTTGNATNVCTTPYSTPCIFDGGTTVDQFVTANGPGRNMNIEQANGPDMRFTTLEDIYGDSGESFQVAFGFLTVEATGLPPAPQPAAGFGVAIDDVKVDWREFRLDKDTTNCDTSVIANRCATVDLQSTNFFDGNALITVTVVDDFPRGGASGAFNDCNYDGVFSETTTDCDGNGVPDIVARVANDRSSLVRDLEVLYLNRVGSTNEYKGTIPISVSYNVPGTLFIIRNGVDIPTVTAQYTDYDAGNGQKCKNDPDAAKWGIIEDGTAVFPPLGRVGITKVRLTDNGDNDGFADAGETVSAFLTFNNKAKVNLENITVTLDTNDSKIECISSPVVALANLAVGQTLEQATPFVFRVSPTANRVGVNDDFSAVFTVTLRSDQFDSLDRSTQFTLDLDLDASGTCTSTSFSEGFEGGTFGQFTSMSLDSPAVASPDGLRCQYNDPAGPNPNDPGRANCAPGTNISAYDWHVHTTAMNDGGRAYGGNKSLHWGIHPPSGAVDDTAHFQQLDAIRMDNVVNLGLTSPIELTYKQQVSLADNRCTNTADGLAADRFAVAAQLADAGGTGFGPWFKLYAYENQYDRQATDQFSNCTFDPSDDGNNEDSFFDPTDPLRRLGPSTLCFPEFVYANQGDTDYRNTFVNATSGLGSAEGPGLQGAINRGTWVMPKFNLDRLKGRRLRVRFVASSIEVYPATDETQLGFADNQTCDDGVYIDDVQVSGACTTPLTLAVDTKTPPTAGCGACSTVTAALTADDASLDAPGQAVVLSADTSTTDKCVDGVLQFRFFLDTNGNNLFDQGTDTILREWTDNPVFREAPTGNSTYGVLVRCSSDPNCGASLTNASAIKRICVNCPSSGGLAAGPFAPTIGFTKVSGSNVNITWSPSSLVDVIRGNLDLLRSSGGNFTGTVQGCLADNFTGTSVNDVAAPSPGSGNYYLVRIAASLCNQQGTWSTGNIKEVAGRNLEVNLDCNTCP